MAATNNFKRCKEKLCSNYIKKIKKAAEQYTTNISCAAQELNRREEELINQFSDEYRRRIDILAKNYLKDIKKANKL